MFKDEVTAMANGAKGKVNLLEKNLLGYIMASMLAGMYIGFGSILYGVVGGVFTAGGAYSTKLICGLVFSVGLCFVTMGGAELFTGNNLAMAMGAFKKTITWGQAVKLWVVCWLGNLAGSVLTSLIFTMTGIPGSGDIGIFFANAASAKMNGAASQLFSKAILCNICVCIAIWCAGKLKSEGAKIAIVFCCVTTFVTCGFEHSVANMTYLTIGMLNMNGLTDISMGGYIYNLLIVTLGNMVGGILFVALPYYLISQTREK